VSDVLDLFGVRMMDATRPEAVALMDRWIHARDGRARLMFIANAHTLNLACEDAGYRAILNRADVVFGDGTGVRLAARMRGIRLKDNLVGTDLLPLFFCTTARCRHRVFLLGGRPGTAALAAERLGRDFPGLEIAGHHHGYVPPRRADDVIAAINRASPDLLLVAMGNPVQERWLDQHRGALDVPLGVGVGGLFDHWTGELRRAPRWVRRLGVEWMQILLQQPHKWRRYVLGNPRFVYRALRDSAGALASGGRSHA